MRLSNLGRLDTRGATPAPPLVSPARSINNLLHLNTQLNGSRVTNQVTRRSFVPVIASAVAEGVSTKGNGAKESEPFRVVIAGAGIGGLVLAVGLLKQGFKVTILERDLTAIRGEGKYRGPIQVQSNALAALEALDTEVADKIMAEGCITGDRVNGLCDGVTGDWYCKFDTFHPAVDKGLPVTRVISRFTLQEILADKVAEIGGPDIIINDCQVVDFKQEKDAATGKEVVHAITDTGKIYTGDLLVGADGIHSKVRKLLVGTSEPNYSEYTCYTGISDFTPPDIDTVGYRVFLGNGQYFVSSDVGGGKMQWYGFHREPPGGDDPPGKRKERLLKIFGHWSDMVTDLIHNTPEDDVLRRDIYDRAPIFKWTEGRVVLLGDSAHAMQPNLGQGGCMAIEDAFQLVQDLGKEMEAAQGNGTEPNVSGVLTGYYLKRFPRAAAIHGMAGMAANMASTYKAYLGEGLGPLEALTSLKIPHPGRVFGQAVIKMTMPGVLDWVLGGYRGMLSTSGRKEVCRITDQPTGFSESDFPLFMRDDDALLRAANAGWFILPETVAAAFKEDGAVLVTASGITIGSADSSDVVNKTPGVAATHVKITRTPEGDYFVTDLGAEIGSYLNDRRLGAHAPTRVRPGDRLRLGGELADDSNVYRVKMKHASLMEGAGHGQYDRRQAANVVAPEMAMSS